MYSGSDSTESQKYAQWALNPSTYQNVNNEEVDWAALAQQWIIMKEAGPPPIPGEQPVLLSKQQQQAIKDIEEGGEAPMDVENDETSTSNWNTQQMVPPTSGLSMESWSSWSSNQAPYWNNQWNEKPPLLPTPSGTAGNFSQFSMENNSETPTLPFAPPNSQPLNEFSASGGYWTANKQIKPHNRRYSKVNVPRPIQQQTSPTVAAELPPVVPTAPPTLDANKRKQLPAWIREGLEKMERDKMKQLEKEREKQERDEYNEKLKQNEIEKMEILKSTIKEQQLLRSKFESDNEDSDTAPPPVRNKRVSSPPPITLTSDELMLKVRRTMTQILLNVTTHHIETIAKEELDRYKRKRKASDQRSSAPSGANISAKLGLGIYGDGSSSENDDTDDKGEEDNDSDAELKDTIRRKTLEFAKIEREIEAKLNEYKKMGNESRSSTPETNDNDSQVDARFQGRKHSPENRTPPHRQQNESGRKKRSSSPLTTDDEHYTSRKSRKSRRSTSSTSNFSNYSDNKKMRRNFSRSRTPPINKMEKSTSKRNKRSRSRDRESRRRRSRSYSRSRHRHRRSRSSSYTKRRYRRDSSSSSGSRRRSRSNSRRKTTKRRRSSSSHSDGGDGRRGKRSQHRH